MKTATEKFLKKAIFKYAVRFDKPIIPITMSFRERKGITRLFSKTPCVDLHVGDPLFPDKTLSAAEAMDKLHAEAYHVMQVMNGINPGDPTYNTDQNIETYKKTMWANDMHLLKLDKLLEVHFLSCRLVKNK